MGIFEIEILHVYVLPESSPIVFEDARYLGDAFSLPKEKVSDIMDFFHCKQLPSSLFHGHKTRLTGWCVVCNGIFRLKDQLF